MPTLNKNTKIFLNYAISVALFSWLVFSIYHQVIHQKDIWTSLKEAAGILRGIRLLGLLGVLVLMILNWGIEARKWQILVRPIENIGFLRSFMAILTGVSLAINTPNRLGDYGGRIIYLKNSNKLKGITVTFVSGFSQLIVTVLFGIIGLGFFILHFPALTPGRDWIPGFWEKSLLFILAGLGSCALILYFRLDLITGFFDRWSLVRRMRPMVRIMNRISKRELGYLLGLSVIRYFVFTTQYLVLLYLFSVRIPWGEGFLLISLTFLVLALIPTLSILELPVRGRVNLFFLGLVSSNKFGIIAGTFGIWFINLILPAVLGSILLLRVKVFSDK